MAARRPQRKSNIGSTSKQLNYLYNLESKTISSFSNLAKKFFAQGSHAMQTVIGNIADIDIAVPIVGPERGARRSRDASPARRNGRPIYTAAVKQAVKKSAPKKASAKKAAKKAAPKKAVKKAAPKKAEKKA